MKLCQSIMHHPAFFRRYGRLRRGKAFSCNIEITKDECSLIELPAIATRSKERVAAVLMRSGYGIGESRTTPTEMSDRYTTRSGEEYSQSASNWMPR